MADIKRPHYFTRQFLAAADFNDEQAYHVRMRRGHYALQHTWGVIRGLDVTRIGANQVRIDPGMAVDSAGREIVLEDARTHLLATQGNRVEVFLTVRYAEVPSDPSALDGVENFTRIAEHPSVVDSVTAPPADGSVILLARIHLNDLGIIDPSGGIDATVRKSASTLIAPGAVGVAHLADGAVTPAKLAQQVKPFTVHPANSITVDSDAAQRRVTIGENHSTRTNNPHAVTAAQIDVQGGANRIVAQINAGAGIISRFHVEPEPVTMAKGLVFFANVTTSDAVISDIDPGLGAGALIVQLGLEDVPGINMSSFGDAEYARPIRLRAEINALTGRFKVIVARIAPSPPGAVTVRWFAFRPPHSPLVAAGVSEGARGASLGRTRSASGKARTSVRPPKKPK